MQFYPVFILLWYLGVDNRQIHSGAEGTERNASYHETAEICQDEH